MTAHCAITHLEEDEVAELHQRLVTVLRLAGLKGAPLDHAAAAAFRTCVVAIQEERMIDEKRRAQISVVQP